MAEEVRVGKRTLGHGVQWVSSGDREKNVAKLNNANKIIVLNVHGISYSLGIRRVLLIMAEPLTK